MSTINTPPTSSNLPYIYHMPSKAFIAGGWGKFGENPAEKQQDFAGPNNEANQLAAKSLLDCVNTEVEVLQTIIKQNLILLETQQCESYDDHLS